MPSLLPDDLLSAFISSHTGRMLRIEKREPLGGGSISRAYKITSSEGIYFLKENDPKAFPGMFTAEEKGLALLAKASALIIPECIGSGEIPGLCFLILRYLESSPPREQDAEEFGARLAAQHRVTQNQFGLDHDNYIGSLPQSNHLHDSWPGFFATERILPQLKMARDKGLAGSLLCRQAEHFCAELDNLFPREAPALLHGDLWNGNTFYTRGGAAVFDPAVYFGHREMDLAMTQLFGGFEARFYAGYRNSWPLEKGWEKRMDYCNLYPLLVHLNLFGEGYLRDIRSILKTF